MSRSFPTVLLLTFVSHFALAAAPVHKLRRCTVAESRDLDVTAMDIIKANNFSDGVVYTAVEISTEEGTVGIAELEVTKAGVALARLNTCSDASRNSISIDNGIPLAQLLKDKKKFEYPLDGEYLNSDEHEALSGSGIGLSVKSQDDDKSEIEAKYKLKVADVTEKKRHTETIQGTFTFKVGNVRLK